jgi:hypothetical protein
MIYNNILNDQIQNFLYNLTLQLQYKLNNKVIVQLN